MVRSKNRLADLQRKANRRTAMNVAPPTALSLKASHGEREEMVRNHIDLLQNIEAMITAYAAEYDIDDRVIRRALEASIIKSSVPEESAEHGLLEFLTVVQDSRFTVSETLWQRALRVVLSSVKNHSSFEPGETSYLDFIRQYT